jgi:hypothetical protein
MRQVARDRRTARYVRAETKRLEALIRESDAQLKELRTGVADVWRQNADLEESAYGHEAAARQLSRWLWRTAVDTGHAIVMDYAVQAILRHYLPELGRPTTAPPSLQEW